ncbi:MAG: UDP-glucose 4-epimerase GalE [Lachnospiraceae bacterium]|nr:UDP-glucose 4-epimerase GalE [Lachnospiraceae bacterium]
MAKEILVTGGAGFIGSHTVVEMIGAGYTPVIVDNLVNANIKVLDRIETITGVRPAFYEADILDGEALDRIFDAHSFEAVIHFAGLKAVGESVVKPLEYYYNNISGTVSLLFAMRKAGVKNLVFSSSATVYGDPAFVPITEECPLGITTNPYGTTKAMIERILTDLAKSDPAWNVMLLRYFNPIGAHESGLIGEDPKGIPNNLVPYVARVAAGTLPVIHVYGNDYPTPDGTGIRDYIHVVDLAKGHICALRAIPTHPGVRIFNLGTGHGYSVLDVIHAYEKAVGHALPYVIEARRPGDIAVCYADPARAKKELGWEAELGLDEMCASSWKWQSGNPNGFAEA